MLKIAVVGAANLDIRSASAKPMLSSDSNPGTVGLFLGGVGRNLAQDFAQMGDDVTFYTAIGEDSQGDIVKASLKAMKVVLAPSQGMATGTYVCMEDSDGRLLFAVNAMEIASAITVDFLRSYEKDLLASDVIVFETNIPKQAVDYLSSLDARLACDAVSTFKAVKLKDCFDRLTYCKMNRAEARILAGLDESASFDSFVEALSKGDRVNLVSLGDQGSCLFSSRELSRKPAPKASIVSVNGAGDALFAAVVHCLCLGYDYDRALEIGNRACRLSLESMQAVSEKLGPGIFKD